MKTRLGVARLSYVVNYLAFTYNTYIVKISVFKDLYTVNLYL